MKDSEIYRRAAEIMDDPLHEFASCSAIANAFYGTQRNNDWPSGSAEYQELTEPFLDLFDGIQHTSLEQRNTRVLALCFMAAIAESEGRRMKLTPWFPPEVKPVHVGVYETQVAGGAWFDFWDGKNWWVGHLTPEKAMMSHQYEPQLYIPLPPITWRGLAEKP